MDTVILIYQITYSHIHLTNEVIDTEQILNLESWKHVTDRNLGSDRIQKQKYIKTSDKCFIAL